MAIMLEEVAVGWVKQIGAKWQSRRACPDGIASGEVSLNDSEFQAMAVIQQGFPGKLKWVDITTPGNPRTWEARQTIHRSPE